jgi:hypothetical protein
MKPFGQRSSTEQKVFNYTSLQILTLKKYSSRKVLFFINLHMLNTKFIIYTE